MRVLDDEAGKVDLLLSDIVLPGGVSGPEIADRTRDHYPQTKLVFMSGYAADFDTTGRIRNIGGAILHKPFKRADLAKVIRDTLAS